MHEAQIMSHLRIFYCYLDMFTIAENPAFFPGYYPYTLPPEFSKNPRVSLRPTRQCSFISPLEGAGKDTLCSVVSTACTAAALLLKWPYRQC